MLTFSLSTFSENSLAETLGGLPDDLLKQFLRDCSHGSDSHRDSKAPSSLRGSLKNSLIDSPEIFLGDSGVSRFPKHLRHFLTKEAAHT